MWKNVRLLVRFAARDITAFLKYGRYLAYIRYNNYRNTTIPIAFQNVAKRFPQKPMFIHGDRKWTYKEAEQFTNQVGNYFTSQGFKAGDDVALMMENRPEFVLLWLGLSKIGVSTALLNTNLKSAPLLHCTTSVKAKAVIFSSQMAPQISTIANDLKQISSPKFFHYGGDNEERGETEGENIYKAIQNSSSSEPNFRANRTDTLMYVYTSGTTGLPKAAPINHSRYLVTAAASRYMAGLHEDDVEYCFLPLYHFAAGGMQMSQTVLFGLTAVVVPGFSASTFWDDIIKYRCTATQYIGEICRYLLAQPNKPQDTQHMLRIMIGNGMRPQIWEAFQNRFKVPAIHELYGATEGNGNILNIDGRPGAVGMFPIICRMSHFLTKKIVHRYIIKVDPETGVPLRGPDGLCIIAGANEPGEYVAEITKAPEMQFDGYTDKKASSKKIYRDVVTKGDRCFASGDILVCDDEGYLFFVDRTGDTFRWRGENVSTAEVEGIVSKHADLKDCAVIGVDIPGCEGKAGMAVIHDPRRETDLQEILRKISQELPTYAVPLFIRLTDSFEMTATFKCQKNKLVEVGFDINRTSDPIYFLDSQKGNAEPRYVKLNEDLYNDILSGRIRL